jgi:hypothetical protein
MKHTLRATVLAACLAAVGSTAYAQALQPSQWNNANVRKLHISGATAPQLTLVGTVETTLCGNEYIRLSNLTGGGTSVTGETTRQFAWGCTIGGIPTVIYYTTLGSNYGVQPVIQGTALPRLNQADPSCPATLTLGGAAVPPGIGAAPNANSAVARCEAIIGGVPDVGISDIAPKGFVNVAPDGAIINNVPSAADVTGDYSEMSNYPAAVAALTTEYTPAQAIGLTVRPVQGVIFGLIASNPLVTAMGGTFGTDAEPSSTATIGLPIARKLMTLSGVAKDDILQALGVPPGPELILCRRAATSGTNAWGNIYYRDVTSLGPRTVDSDDITVSVNLTSSDVRNCVHNATLAGKYAIGILSRESSGATATGGSLPTNTSTTVAGGGRRYSYLRIGGATPDITGKDKGAAIAASYDNIGEVTLQYRNSVVTGTKLTLLNSLVTGLTGTAVCGNAGAVRLPNESGVKEACEISASRGSDPFGEFTFRPF